MHGDDGLRLTNMGSHNTDAENVSTNKITHIGHHFRRVIFLAAKKKKKNKKLQSPLQDTCIYIFYIATAR